MYNSGGRSVTIFFNSDDFMRSDYRAGARGCHWLNLYEYNFILE